MSRIFSSTLMLTAVCTLLPTPSSLASQVVTPPFTYGGHTYNVSSTPIGVFLTFSGHWMFEPSVITPSSLTSNQYVMLFSANITPNVGNSNQGVYMVASSSGTKANTSPQLILTNTTSNICDMSGARPIWDGSMWHVYLQAAFFQSGPGSTCLNSPGPNYIVEAQGSSLTNISWVLNPGTNNATAIVSCVTGCSGSAGIGELFQVFNTGPYGGYAPTPYMITYNNWAYSQSPGQVFSYLTNFTQYDYWYNVAQAWTQSTQNVYPDVILDSPAGTSSGTNFSYGVGSVCSNGQLYYYMNSLAFYATPVPYPATPANGNGTAQPGIVVLYSINSFSSDSNGQRGATPRLARNAYGYVDLSGTAPNTWTTYVYYDDAQLVKNPSDNCGPTNWGQGRFSVSQVTFTQQ